MQRYGHDEEDAQERLAILKGFTENWQKDKADCMKKLDDLRTTIDQQVELATKMETISNEVSEVLSLSQVE